MSEYVYFLKDSKEPLMKVGSSTDPLKLAKESPIEINLEESRVIAFPDKEMAKAVIDELRHFLKVFEKPREGAKEGEDFWYSTESKDELLEEAKQLGLKVEPLLD